VRTWHLALLMLLGVAGCEQILCIGGYKRVADSTSAAASGGGGGAPPCAKDEDCDGGTDCVHYVCQGGACVRGILSGNPCPLADGGDGGGFCDYDGICGPCDRDNVQDQGETDVDCGNSACGPCGPGKRCMIPSNCSTHVCNATGPFPQPCAGQTCCAIATCTDGVQNGDETGIDCGGSCKGCPPGSACQKPGDCDVNAPFCAQSVCCGVPCDLPCQQCLPPSGACVDVDGGKDPQSGCTCNGNPGCFECTDHVQDLKETDVDCGGGVCPKCANGKKCVVGPRDCASCICQGGACAPPLCDDGVLDGCESDTDCGGPCGATCGSSQNCHTKADCASGSCVDGGCQGP
jgi:hypothetical protein